MLTRQVLPPNRARHPANFLTVVPPLFCVQVSLVVPQASELCLSMLIPITFRVREVKLTQSLITPLLMHKPPRLCTVILVRLSFGQPRTITPQVPTVVSTRPPRQRTSVTLPFVPGVHRSRGNRAASRLNMRTVRPPPLSRTQVSFPLQRVLLRQLDRGQPLTRQASAFTPLAQCLSTFRVNVPRHMVQLVAEGLTPSVPLQVRLVEPHRCDRQQ